MTDAGEVAPDSENVPPRGAVAVAGEALKGEEPASTISEGAGTLTFIAGPASSRARSFRMTAWIKESIESNSCDVSSNVSFNGPLAIRLKIFTTPFSNSSWTC